MKVERTGRNLKKIDFLPEGIRNWYINLISPATDLFIRLGVNPNFFTTVGFLISIVATYVVATGHLRWGGVLILLGGTFDILDGKVARATDRVTKFGALYDSTLDRYSEVMIFFGLAYYFSSVEIEYIGIEWSIWIVVAISIAIGGSVMTSYVRARAEGLGLECKVGIMQRAERVVYLGFGALFHEITLILAILVIAVLANVTAIQRIYHIWKTEKSSKPL
ncbi:CDP-alcohol phosphatidyltransferase family protein [candidate division KSB1 bacterium]|nr:CDP-alcohol phosphatidyltransferase family protein [candidate division KSB1 bacterium]